MVDIIRFPKKFSDREAAIKQLCLKIVAHLATHLYEIDQLDGVPLQAYVRNIERLMNEDDRLPDADVILMLADDPVSLNRARERFLDVLVEKGFIKNR